MDTAGADAGSRLTASMAGSIARDSPKIQRAVNGIANAIDSVTLATMAETKAKEAKEAADNRASAAAAEYEKHVNASTEATKEGEAALKAHTRAMNDAKNANDGLTRATIARERSERTLTDAHRSGGSALQSYANDIRKAEEAARRAADTTTDWKDQLSDWGRTAGYAFRGSAIIGAPIIINNIISAVGALAGAVGPATAAVGGLIVGVESLKLATMGFGQAMTDIRDTEKFSEDLRKLAPNAQLAASALRDLVPMFDSIQQQAQNTLFEGFDTEFANLANGLEPTIRTATTGVSAAFNDMFKAASAEILSPGTLTSISSFVDNTVASFHALEPAIAPAISAFTNFIDVGSSFGPEINATISELAQEFAAFIQESRDDGSLAEWMQRGITAAEALIGTIDDVAKVFGTLGQDGMASINTLVTGIELTSEVIRILNGDVTTLSDLWPTMGKIALQEFNRIGDGLRTIIEPLDWAIQQLNKLGAGIPLIPKPPSLSVDADGHMVINTPTPNQQGRGGLSTTGRGGNGTPPTSGSAGRSGLGRGTAGPLPYGSGLGTSLNGPGGGWDAPREGLGNGFGSKPRKAGAGSDHDRRDAIIAGLDPSQYRVDPYAPVAGMPAVGSTGLTGGPTSPFGGSAYGVSAADVYEKEHNVLTQAHDLEEARKARLAIEKDNTATAQDVEEARWKETQAGYDLWKSQQDLVEKQRGTTAAMKKGMDDLGAALDPDFGLSKGLAGLAENLTKFVGNIATAPFRAQMQQAINADPIKGGYGLLGIRGAQNMSQGLSPVLGNPMPDGTQAPGAAGAFGLTTGGATAPSAYGAQASAVRPAMSSGGYTTDAALLANVPKGIGHYDNGVKDLSRGLVDCASGVEDLVNIIDGKSTVGGSLWTGNASSVLPQMGFVPGMGGPGDFRVGYNNHHMQATLPGGTNVNYGSTPAVQSGGTAPNQGAFDPSFTQHYYRPMAGNPAVDTTGGSTAPSLYSPQNTQMGLTGGGGESPVFPGGPRVSPASFGAGPGTLSADPGTLGWGPGTLSTTGRGGGGTLGYNGTSGGMAPGTLSMGPGSLSAAPGTLSGGPAGAGGAPDAGAGTPIGGVAPSTFSPAGGGIGITSGGSLDSAMSMAASAFPGVGQAAQTGMKLANRAIQYAGQVAGIGVQGAMDTFLPTGGSELAQNSWFSRILGGLAGATPAIPNVAGGQQGQQQQQQGGDQPPLSPDQVLQQHLGSGAAPGPGQQITINNNGATPDENGRTVAFHAQQAQTMPGKH